MHKRNGVDFYQASFSELNKEKNHVHVFIRHTASHGINDIESINSSEKIIIIYYFIANKYDKIKQYQSRKMNI